MENMKERSEKKRWNRELIFTDFILIAEWFAQFILLLLGYYWAAFWISVAVFVLSVVYFIAEHDDCSGILMLTSFIIGLNPVFFLSDPFKPGCWFCYLFATLMALLSIVSASIRVSNGYSAY